MVISEQQSLFTDVFVNLYCYYDGHVGHRQVKPWSQKDSSAHRLFPFGDGIISLLVPGALVVENAGCHYRIMQVNIIVVFQQCLKSQSFLIDLE